MAKKPAITEKIIEGLDLSDARPTGMPWQQRSNLPPFFAPQLP
jgi:hypothetical protein